GSPQEALGRLRGPLGFFLVRARLPDQPDGRQQVRDDRNPGAAGFIRVTQAIAGFDQDRPGTESLAGGNISDPVSDAPTGLEVEVMIACRLSMQCGAGLAAVALVIGEMRT